MKSKADAILSALEAAGCAVVPDACAYIKIDGDPVHELRGPIKDVYAMLIAHSPYRKE